MDYILSYLVENDNSERLRAFADMPAAKRYVVRLAKRLGRMADRAEAADPLSRTMYVSLADIYLIQPSGAMRHVAHFDGHDRGDGHWHGWEDV